MDASPELPPGDHIWLPVAIPFGEWAAGLPEHCLKLAKQKSLESIEHKDDTNHKAPPSVNSTQLASQVTCPIFPLVYLHQI